MVKKISHDDLVVRGIRWLKSVKRCKVIVTRSKGSMCIEEPDVIGWNAHGFSFLIECKVSRNDFRRDQKKSHRLLKGVGGERYYLTPPELLKTEELPVGWGLLEAMPRTIRKLKEAEHRPEPDRFREVQLLVWWNRGVTSVNVRRDKEMT